MNIFCLNESLYNKCSFLQLAYKKIYFWFYIYILPFLVKIFYLICIIFFETSLLKKRKEKKKYIEYRKSKTVKTFNIILIT